MGSIKGQKHNPYIEGKYGHLNPNDVVFTPDWLAKQIVGMFDISGKVLEPCKGEGAFLNHLPKNTEWCEIADGKNYYDYTEKVDWIVTNPPYCFVNAEAYTKDGWKHIKDIKIGELVLSVFDNLISWKKVTNIIIENYNGNIYSCEKKHTKFKVTPNHKFLTNNGLKEAKSFNDNQYFPRFNFKWETTTNIENITIPTKEYIVKHRYGERIIKYEEQKIKIDNWLKFFGFWLADGCICKHHYCISITQSNENSDLIVDILNGIGYKYNIYDNKNGTSNFNIYNKQLHEYMVEFGNSYTKFIPSWIKELPTDKIELFLDYYMLGDLTKCRTHEYISTVSIRLKDDLQECFLKCGTLLHFSFNKKNKLYSALSNPTSPYQVRKSDLNIEEYNGDVYCLTVENNHTFLARVEESVYFSGNSDYNRFLDHSFDLADNIVLLVPVAKMFKSMGTMSDIFDYGGFVEIHTLPSSKAGFPFGFPSAVYYLKRGYKGDTKIKMLDGITFKKRGKKIKEKENKQETLFNAQT